MAFFVSTTSFGSEIFRAIRFSRNRGVPIEFGSGVEYYPKMECLYRNLDIDRIPHNYFPASKDPFVLNLASLNPSIRCRSVEHCRNGLSLARTSDSPFYSAHAGFCIDPDPEHLGRQWNFDVDYDLDKSYDAFCASVESLADRAASESVDFLLENNVVTSSNVDECGNTPLLCAYPDELERFFQDVDHPRVGLLLDTGHLKVTAQTFGFDLHKATERLKPYVGGIHHSDNDGQADTNSPIGEDYWFLRHLSDFRDTPHVLEVKDQSIDSILRQIDLLKRHCDL